MSWNIQGLKTRLKPTEQTISNTKLNIKSIKSKLSKFDIICLQETWAKDETLTFQGYTVYSTVKNTVSKRGQAGVSVLIRDHHQNFVSRIHSDSPNIIWCRLDKQLLGLQADIFLAAVYLPPGTAITTKGRRRRHQYLRKRNSQVFSPRPNSFTW